ncbi:hypothetical protein VTL71DRAFT_9775 [Oculimacula yallundae]|uniref:Reverse transcriptase domain-containing protein n=1 Tax=Oculimacula yallundae TaxID=86028 RepID=A0ABR4BRU9_9HELO
MQRGVIGSEPADAASINRGKSESRLKDEKGRFISNPQQQKGDGINTKGKNWKRNQRKNKNKATFSEPLIREDFTTKTPSLGLSTPPSVRETPPSKTQFLPSLPTTPTPESSNNARPKRRRTASLPYQLEEIRDQIWREDHPPVWANSTLPQSTLFQSVTFKPKDSFQTPAFQNRQPSPELSTETFSSSPTALRAIPTPSPIREQNQFQHDRYQFQSDAMFILAVKEELDKGGLVHLAGLIPDSMVRQAKRVIKGVEERILEGIRDLANKALGHDGVPALATSDNWNRFLATFKEGPPDNQMSVSGFSNTRSSVPTENPLPSTEKGDNRGNHNSSRGNRPTPNPNPTQRRNGVAGGGFPGDGDDNNNGDASNGSVRNFHRGSGSNRNRSAARSGFSSNRRRLRAQDVRNFNRTNMPVTSYVAILNMLVTNYGEEAVLEVLPLCMKDEAAIWLGTLSPEVMSLMTQSIEEWKIQLMRQYHTNASEAIRKADALRHTFKTESELPLRKYLDDKYSLYVESGETNQDLIVRRIHQHMDPSLAASVSLKDSFNTVNEFRAKVANVESQAREAYFQTQHKLDEQSNQIEEIKKLISSVTKKSEQPSRDTNPNHFQRNRNLPQQQVWIQPPIYQPAILPTAPVPNQAVTITPQRYGRPWLPNAEYAAIRQQQREANNRKGLEVQSSTLIPNNAPTARRGYEYQKVPMYAPATPVMLNQLEEMPLMINQFGYYQEMPYQGVPYQPTEQMGCFINQPDYEESDEGFVVVPSPEGPPIKTGPLIKPTDKATSDELAVLVNGTNFSANTHGRIHFLTEDTSLAEAAADTGSPIGLIDYSSAAKFFPSTAISSRDDGMTVQLTGVGSGPSISKFIEVPISCPTISGKKTLQFPSYRLYLVPNLPGGVLFGLDFFSENQLDIKWGVNGKPHQLHLNGSDDFIHLKTKREETSPKPIPRRTNIYLLKTTVIKAGEGVNLPITHRLLPPREDGYLVQPKPQADIALGKFGSVLNAITNGTPQPLPFTNFGEVLIRLKRGTCIGVLEENPHRSLSQDLPVYLSLAGLYEGQEPIEEQAEGVNVAGAPFLIRPLPDEPGVEPDISDAFGPEIKGKIKEVLEKHQNLFRPELNRFNDGVVMPVPFKEGVEVNDLRQPPYPQSKRDREEMDKILDPMVADGSLVPVPLGRPSPASAPAFVVYRNGKPRVVVDLRKVNTKLQLNAYPLPKADDVLSAIGGATIFSSVDMTKSFFQQPLAPEDQWKTALVTAHRGHEMLTVATMGLATTPSFFQARMEKLFRNYLWKFVVVYIDDIIIFSRTPDQHVLDLDLALTLLENAGVTLALAKCHFAQPSIEALGHKVSRLGLNTLEDKVEAVRKWEFPETLSNLEKVLGFFGYYRKFIAHYAAISAPLIELKTIGFKDAPREGKKRAYFATAIPIPLPLYQPIQEPNPNVGKKAKQKKTSESRSPEYLENLMGRCRLAFDMLKEKLTTTPILGFPDFDRPFILYVDGSKEYGYRAALHQIDADGNEKPILFLSKSLSPAERNYWPTELKTGALV